MHDYRETVKDAIRLIERRDYSEAVTVLTGPAALDPKGKCQALLATAHFLREEYDLALPWISAALAKTPGVKDWEDLLAAARENAKAAIQVPVPDLYYFEADKLLNRAFLFDLPVPLPARPENCWELWRREVGRFFGVGATSVVNFATDLLGTLAGYRDQIWTNWYRRPLSLGVLTLAYMRERLNKYNLRTTYARGALVGLLDEVPPQPQGVASYRTADGSWNNLDDPLEGAAGTRFLRNVRPEAIKPEAGERLLTPNPREVSRKLLTRQQPMREVQFLNMLAASWIQFQNHDWINHGEIQYVPAQYEIPLAPDDPARLKYHQLTMFVGKTQSDPTWEKRGREDVPIAFINEVTHWWDGSQIYGSDQETQNRLRSGIDGKLRLKEDGTLPLDGKGLEITGFNRNWWIGLTILHTLFSREHNAICDHLKTFYPQWEDNRLFNVGRLINAAIMAKIHTVEWTPAILPNRVLNYALDANWFGILTNPFAYGRDRETLSEIKITNPELGGIVGNPIDKHGASFGLSEEFVEVYRLHSLLPETLRLRKIGGDSARETPFRETRQAGSARLTEEYGIANLLYSFGTQLPGQLVLNNFPQFMQELSIPGNPLFDLGAVDILRARERGVPRYNEFRRQLGLEPIHRFEDLLDDPLAVQRLKEVYGTGPDAVENLDLLIGTLAEGHRPTSFGFGETMFQIFILNASRRLQADRFYTTNYNEDTYTREGLTWIDESSLKIVLLRNFPELAKTGLANITNAFEPWDEDRTLNPKRHPLRAFDEELGDDKWTGDRYR